MTPNPAPTPSEAPRPVLDAHGSLSQRIEAARIARQHAAGDHRDCPNCRRFTARDNSGAIYGRGAA